MSDVQYAPTPTRSSQTWWRPGLRWMVTFAGFPAGGLAAKLLAGRVDSVSAALIGGVVTGAILGAVQAWGLGRKGASAFRWIAATGVGFGVGLGIGAAAVDYGTGLGRLVVQGAVCGVAVGAAQALELRPQFGRFALLWVPFLSAMWALAWVITTAAGVQVHDQFTVFGSTGAIVVTAATAILPILQQRKGIGR